MKKIKALRSKLAKSINNQKGQGATEYILLLVVVVGVVMSLKGPLQEKMKSAMDKLGENINAISEN